MTIKTPTETTYARTKIETLPPAGEGRFWYVVHNPASEAKPLVLQLRQSTRHPDQPVLISFSNLIGKISTIADEVQITTAAKELLARAGRADEFIGALNQEVTA